MEEQARNIYENTGEETLKLMGMNIGKKPRKKLIIELEEARKELGKN